MKNRLRSRTRIKTSECHSLLSLKNRRRSRTRITTFNYQIFRHLKNRLRSRTRITTCEHQILLSLKNRLRSRTRITTCECQILLSFKNRLRSRTRITTLVAFQELLCAIQCVRVRVSSGSSASMYLAWRVYVSRALCFVKIAGLQASQNCYESNRGQALAWFYR